MDLRWFSPAEYEILIREDPVDPTHARTRNSRYFARIWATRLAAVHVRAGKNG